MKTSSQILFAAVLFVGLAAGCAGESPDEQIASAKAYLKNKDTKAAVIQIKNALQQNPELPEARYLLGLTFLEEGNPVAAEVELRKATAAKYPGNLVVPELARAMLMLGQAKKVVEEFGSTRFDSPTADASLQTTLAVAYGVLGKPEQARTALSAALAADPAYLPALLAHARQKAVARDFDGALQVTEEVIAKDAGNADALKLKADILQFGQAKPDDALAAYRKAIEAQPSYLPAHLSVLALLLQQGKLDEAGQQLEQLKKYAANAPQTKYFEAQLAYQKKDFKQARELSVQLLQQAPNNPWLLQLAGAVELQMGALPQAEIYLSTAVKTEPRLVLARRLLITTYLRSGQAAKALTALNESAGPDDIDPAMYSLAGEVFLQNGDAKRAEEYFAKALKLDPDNAKKRTAVAITKLAGGQAATGFEELQNIAETDPSVTADLAVISVHLRRNEYDKALAAIDKLEAKQPDKPAAAYMRGRVQLVQKDVVAARKSFERALSIDPAFFAAAASLAAIDVAEKKPDDAKKRFESLLAKNPKNVQALLAMAQLAVVNGAGKDEVAALLTKAIDANPSEIAPRLLLVDLHLRDQDNKLALAAAQSAVASLPNSPDAMEALGRTQQVSGDYNQAIASYSKLIALQPLSPLPHIRMAEAQVVSKNNLAAEQSLRKALELQPDALDAQRGLIILLVADKKFQDALVVARNVQKQRPKDATGFVLEGDILVQQKDWSGAATAYRAALQQAPSSMIAVKLHAVLGNAGRAAEADRFAASWLKEQPKDTNFLTYLGDTALSRKDFAQAQKNYLAILKIQPENPVALNNLAWLSLQQGADSALAYAQRANELAPNQPAFMDTYAMVLSARGEHARAIELQVKALALQPTNTGLKLNLAKIYIAAGEKPKARATLEDLAKLGETHVVYKEVMALLGQI